MSARPTPLVLPSNLDWLRRSFAFGPAPVRSVPAPALRFIRFVAWWGGVGVHLVLAALWAWDGALVFSAVLAIYAAFFAPLLLRARPSSFLLRFSVDAAVIVAAATLAGSAEMALPWLFIMALVPLACADTASTTGVLAISAILVPISLVAARGLEMQVAAPLSDGQMAAYMYLGFVGEIVFTGAVAMALGASTLAHRAKDEEATRRVSREQERLSTLFETVPIPVAEIDLMEVVDRCRAIQRRHLKSLERSLTSESELSDNLIGMIRLVRVNTAWACLFARDPERLVGAVNVDRMPESIKSAFRRIVHALFRGETSGSFRLVFETLDGTSVHGQYGFDVVGAPSTPDYSRVITTVIDETERAQLAETLETQNRDLVATLDELEATHNDLVEGRKMEAIGVLASGIAHEINTPIQFVGDNLRFLGDAGGDVLSVIQAAAQTTAEIKAGQLRPETIAALSDALEAADVEFLLEEMPAAVAQATEGVERVAAIVRAMKEFAHPGSDDLEPADVNHAIETAVTVSRNEWKYVADLKLDLDPGLGMVPVLGGPLNQVLLNLIVNAAHAIAGVQGSGKGTITITTRHEHEWAVIAIADTGGGIPEEIRDRIFEPFYTTKEVGKGSGQGLAIAHRVVVERHRGRIDVDSTVGVGTTFTIRIPLEPGAHTEAA